MYIFGINGIALSGKDSFVQRVQYQAPGKVACISTIDPVKEYYSSIGWDGSKTSEHRKVLNTIKRMWILGHIRIADCDSPNTWVIQQCMRFEREGTLAVFVMVREFEEMVQIKEIGDSAFRAGKTIRVVRDGLEVPMVEKEFIESHPSDYIYDITVMNPTTKDAHIPLLSEAAEDLMELIQTHFPDKKIIWDANYRAFVGNKITAQIY